MSLNLYVMPMHRFLARDFDPPLARLGIPFKRITPAGVVDPPRAGSASPSDLDLGRRKTANIRAKVGEVNRVQLDWPDDGDAVFTEQVHGSMDGLQAFATWLEYADRLPEFQVLPGPDYTPHPVWKINRTYRRPPTLPQLVQHSLFVGSFLPCDFERPVLTHTLRVGPAAIPVYAASTPRLLAELSILNDLLRVPEDFLQREREFEHHPYRFILMAFDQLRRAAELSLRHRLPMIFEG